MQPRGPLSQLKKKVLSLFRHQQPKSLLDEIHSITPIVSPLYSQVDSVKYFPISCAPATPAKQRKCKVITAGPVKENAKETTASPVNEKVKEVTLAGPGTNKKPVRPVQVCQTTSVAKMLHGMHLRKEQAKAKAILAMQPREREPVVLSEAGRPERARQMVLNEMAFGCPVVLVAF